MKNRIYNLIFTIVFLTSSCQAQPKDAIPEHETLIIASKILGESRVINIWMPQNYKTSSDSYPVLYMPDGGIKEDFPHIANTLSKLIDENKIPPHILVGIENTERRHDLAGPTTIKYDLEFIKNPDGANNFRKFIKEELFVEINTKYKTTNKKAIIGESLAGLFAVETFLLDSEMFDTYIAFDPSLWYNEQYLVKNFESLSKSDYNKNKALWFAGSSAKDISKYTKQLVKMLEKSDNNLLWKYQNTPKEKHNTIFRALKEEALIWSLKSKK
jgi:predicted alpha/beta superfamily hydrolase